MWPDSETGISIQREHFEVNSNPTVPTDPQSMKRAWYGKWPTIDADNWNEIKVGICHMNRPLNDWIESERSSPSGHHGTQSRPMVHWSLTIQVTPGLMNQAELAIKRTELIRCGFPADDHRLRPGGLMRFRWQFHRFIDVGRSTGIWPATGAFLLQE